MEGTIHVPYNPSIGSYTLFSIPHCLNTLPQEVIFSRLVSLSQAVSPVKYGIFMFYVIIFSVWGLLAEAIAVLLTDPIPQTFSWVMVLLVFSALSGCLLRQFLLIRIEKKVIRTLRGFIEEDASSDFVWSLETKLLRKFRYTMANIPPIIITFTEFENVPLYTENPTINERSIV